MTQQSGETESLPLFINFMAIVVSREPRPKIIVNIYLKVVGLKERKAQHVLNIYIVPIHIFLLLIQLLQIDKPRFNHYDEVHIQLPAKYITKVQ